MDFTKSIQTIGEYPVKNLKKSGSLILGEWQDPESHEWTPGEWDKETGVMERFHEHAPTIYDLKNIS